jgi:hypothetical protein
LIEECAALLHSTWNTLQNRKATSVKERMKTQELKDLLLQEANVIDELNSLLEYVEKEVSAAELNNSDNEVGFAYA